MLHQINWMDVDDGERWNPVKGGSLGKVSQNSIKIVWMFVDQLRRQTNYRLVYTHDSLIEQKHIESVIFYFEKTCTS